MIYATWVWQGAGPREERDAMKHRRLGLTAIVAAMLAAAAIAVPGSGVARAAQGCGGTGAVTTATGTLNDGATYEIQCPAGQWNGTLFLWSHGYVVPGSPNPAQFESDPATGAWLLANGYALAGSSYATTGWAIQQAIPDQVATVATFAATYRKPGQTIAWGASLGGIITAGLVQEYPRLFTAALPACGVLAGGVATWNQALDAAFAFQQLIAPQVQVTGFGLAGAGSNLTAAEKALAVAQQTPQGQARLALVSALGDEPGWFTPGSPEPGATDYAAQEVNQAEWASQVTFPFIFAFRAELEARAGGNPSWNTGVNYYAQLSKSADLNEVVALYKAAGLNLGADLATLNGAPRISANPASVGYLEQNVSFTGRISIPVLTVHTTGDGLVVPEDEQAYRHAVDQAGDGRLLRQLFVDRAGHCAFTPAELVTTINVLLNRLSTGRWQVPSPAQMNAAASALGPQFNVLAPEFTAFDPPQFLRPFTLSSDQGQQ
jgi:hypothetical protein